MPCETISKNSGGSDMGTEISKLVNEVNADNARNANNTDNSNNSN